MNAPGDFHTNPHYWFEYDCPDSRIDFDVSPIPRPADLMHCSGCWGAHRAADVDANVYVVDAQGAAICVTDLWQRLCDSVQRSEVK